MLNKINYDLLNEINSICLSYSNYKKEISHSILYQIIPKLLKR